MRRLIDFCLVYASHVNCFIDSKSPPLTSTITEGVIIVTRQWMGPHEGMRDPGWDKHVRDCERCEEENIFLSNNKLATTACFVPEFSSLRYLSPPFWVCFDNLGLSQVCVPGYIKYYGDKVGLVAAVYVRMGAAYHRQDQQDRAVHCLDNADKIYRWG